jgi:hypothetical protein
MTRQLSVTGTESGVIFWAYGLVDDHVHLIAVPKRVDSFRLGLGKGRAFMLA